MTGSRELKGNLRGHGLRIGIVVARFNESVTAWLLEGARQGLQECGVAAEDVTVVWVPGSFEIPVAAQHVARRGGMDAVVCLGAIIHHETDHDRYLAQAVSQSLATLARETGVPLAFGILTTESEEQALERAGGSLGNRGYDAALTAVEMVNLLRVVDGMEGD